MDTYNVPEMVIFIIATCIKWTLVIKFYHQTCQTMWHVEMRKIVTYKFFNFHIKKRELMNLFD